MDQITAARTNRSAVRLNKIKTFFSKPHNVILLLMGIVLTFSTVAPIIAIVEDTFKIHPGTIDAYLTGKASGYTVVNYIDLFTSDKAMINLWTPPAQHRVAGGGDLRGVHPFRRPVRLFGHPHQSGLAQIPQFHLHLPLHHAPVDPGSGLAEHV